MRRQIRVALGMIILILSVALLVWGFLPSRRETRTQPISPIELQLPTPVSFRVDTASPLSPLLPQPIF
jgi:hypothetical protein